MMQLHNMNSPTELLTLLEQELLHQQPSMQAHTPARTSTPKRAMFKQQATTHRHVKGVVAYWAMCLLPDQWSCTDDISALPQGPLPHALLHLVQASCEAAAIGIVLGVGIAIWT